jgi:hypothetical protein
MRAHSLFLFSSIAFAASTLSCGEPSSQAGHGGGAGTTSSGCAYAPSVSCACDSGLTGSQDVDRCTGQPTSACRCPEVRACPAEAGCKGVQICDDPSYCQPCMCNGAQILSSVSGMGVPRRMAVAPLHMQGWQ